MPKYWVIASLQVEAKDEQSAGSIVLPVLLNKRGEFGPTMLRACVEEIYACAPEEDPE